LFASSAANPNWRLYWNPNALLIRELIAGLINRLIGALIKGPIAAAKRLAKAGLAVARRGVAADTTNPVLTTFTLKPPFLIYPQHFHSRTASLCCLCCAPTTIPQASTT